MKERLIGAAVLVGLGVWLIPWVLDGPERPGEVEPASLELPVPNDPIPRRTQTIQLNERSEPLGSPVPDAQARRQADAEEQAAAARRVAAASEAPEVPAAEAPPAEAVPEETPAEQRAAAPPAEQPTSAAAAEAPASTVPPAPQTPPARAQESVRAAATPAAETGRWMVQLGSFGEEPNARRLAERVATYGYKPEISNVRAGGRTMHRVRVGPYESRSRADAAVSSLSAHGFVGQVVTTD